MKKLIFLILSLIVFGKAVDMRTVREVMARIKRYKFTEANFQQVNVDTLHGKTGRSSTIIVAANNSSRWSKIQADYVCDGGDDNVQIQTALDKVIAYGGGKVVLLEGDFSLGDSIYVNGDDVILNGCNSVLRLENSSANPKAVIAIFGGAGSSINNVTLSDITVNHNYDNQTGGNTPRGVIVQYAENVVVRNVQIESSFVALDFSTGSKYCSAYDCAVITESWNDGFEVSGTAENSYEPQHISFYNCNVLGACVDNPWEIEDGAKFVYLFGCTVDTTTNTVEGFSVRNHGAYNRGSTEYIWFVNCVGKKFYLDGFPATDDSVRNISIINCYGAIAGTADSVQNISVIKNNMWFMYNALSSSIDSTKITETQVLTGIIGNIAQQTTTLGSGITTFAVTSNVVQVTGDGGGNTIATITGAQVGSYTFVFVDGNVTISDDNTHGSNSVDLDASNDFTSADDKVLQLFYDGTSWYKVSESTN